MNHLGDTNKIVSDTPRTNNQIGYDGSTMSAIRIDFCRKLERELNAAYERINRLEEAGDAMADLLEEEMFMKLAVQWRKAKEDKL
jgi:hypothetical protein